MIVCVVTEKPWGGSYVEPNLPPHQYGQRGVYPIPAKVADRDGNPRCRWCLGPVEPPRRAWCSQQCVDDSYLRRNWGSVAALVRERDKVCRMCGGTSYERTVHYGYREDGPYCPLRPYFEVDHIVAVRDGGTDDPENLRLLCRRCHKTVTATQRARWAEENKQWESQQMSLAI